MALAAMVVLIAAAPARADNVLLRGFTWFGFLDGKELREGCAPGAPDRLRFVYNGVYQEQIRVYEFARATPGAPANLRSRVLTRPNFANFSIGELIFGSRDPIFDATLDPPGAEALVGALMADGFADPVPKGLSLPSDGFYWIVSGCLGGRFDIQGWLHPTPRFQALRFPIQLFARDGTGVPVNKPRPVDAGERMRARSGNQSRLDTQPAFDIRLDDDGVVGRVPGF
ncbi:MAG: hypothetical protein IT562_13720 [Alphaproteobacteria bacterium]|nr:hypothetical protein [Alphaproteobacteria bacterium]